MTLCQTFCGDLFRLRNYLLDGSVLFFLQISLRFWKHYFHQLPKDTRTFPSVIYDGNVPHQNQFITNIQML